MTAGLLDAQGRPVRVGRRRYPKIGPRLGRGGDGPIVKREGAEQARAQLAARVDQPHRDQEDEKRAQRPGVAHGQLGARRPQPQPPDPLEQPLAMPRPQGARRRIGELLGQPVAQCPERLVLDAAVPLEPCETRGPVDRREGAAGTPQEPAHGCNEARQHQHMEPRRKQLPDVEEGEEDEQAQNAAHRPQCRVEALEGDDRPRGPDTLVEPRRGGGACIGHGSGPPPGGVAPAPPDPSQAGMRSSASWAAGSRRGLMTAKRSPSTSTSAGPGREL